jgi:TonB family protein
MAAPQVVNDAPGVTVALSGASLLHRSPVEYPAAALRAGIQGTLSVEVKTDAKGTVSDAHVLSGPEELRKAALQSVLQWHFAGDSVNATRVVQITFELPKTTGAQAPATESVTVSGGVGSGVGVGVSGGVGSGAIGGVPAVTVNAIVRTANSGPPPAPQSQFQTGQAIVNSQEPRPIKSITVVGLPDQARNDLLARLPVHEGDTFSNEVMHNVGQAVTEFDEHLSIRYQSAEGGGMAILIIAPGAQPAASSRIKVGGNVQAAMVLSKVQPVYPELAKSARVSGIVHLAVVIAPDGTVQEIKAIDGPALLIAAAMDAVKQWVYRPTLLNGQPTSVETTVDVNFTLNQ